MAQAPYRQRDGFPVGQRAAEPAMVDEILGGTLGGIGNGVRRLALGSDEKHPAAAGYGIGNLDQRLMQERRRLVRSTMWMLLRLPKM